MNKICGHCKQDKDISQFWKRSKNKDGYSYSCIECVRVQNQQSYKNHWKKNRKRIDANHYRITENLREKCNQIKHNIGCYFCKEADPICLDFHHKDSKTKIMNISAMIGSHKIWSVIETEISKCNVICANCHRKIHSGVLSY